MCRCVLRDLVHLKILGFVVLAWGIVRRLPLRKNISQYILSIRFCKYTLLKLWRCRFGSEGRFFKGAPFEVLLIAAALDLPLVTLLARWLRLIALQPFRFASHTT